MKRTYGLLVTALCFFAVFLFFLLMAQGQEQDGYVEEEVTTTSEAIRTEETAMNQTPTEEETPPPAVGDVVAVEDERPYPALPVSLAYEKYRSTYEYFFVEGKQVNLYEAPDSQKDVLKKIKAGQFLNYLETVTIQSGPDETTKWYHVNWIADGNPIYGFVKSSEVIKRVYQFGKMEEAIKRAEDYSSRGRLTYINNYQNLKGKAPLYHGKTVDQIGGTRSQSAPGYPDLSQLEEFTYLGDGTLIRYFFTAGDYAKIEVVATGERYFVPKQYIPQGEELTDLTKVVVIDRANQNEGVFEKRSGTWTMISYSMATTGAQGEYKQPTPLGFYYGIERRSQFLYQEDGTTKIQGYAPYAIRFAGGAYIHGIPVNFKYSEEGLRITPPIQEFSKTIGTVPLSHKCVRNYTSHAKFLYDWFEKGKTIVIVIE